MKKFLFSVGHILLSETELKREVPALSGSNTPLTIGLIGNITYKGASCQTKEQYKSDSSERMNGERVVVVGVCVSGNRPDGGDVSMVTVAWVMVSQICNPNGIKKTKFRRHSEWSEPCGVLPAYGEVPWKRAQNRAMKPSLSSMPQFFFFLDASSQLYMRTCPSPGRSVGNAFVKFSEKWIFSVS